MINCTELSGVVSKRKIKRRYKFKEIDFHGNRMYVSKRTYFIRSYFDFHYKFLIDCYKVNDTERDLFNVGLYVVPTPEYLPDEEVRSYKKQFPEFENIAYEDKDLIYLHYMHLSFFISCIEEITANQIPSALAIIETYLVKFNQMFKEKFS